MSKFLNIYQKKFRARNSKLLGWGMKLTKYNHMTSDQAKHLITRHFYRNIASS